MTDQDLPLQDRDLQMVPEDMRSMLADRGRNDLYWFARAVLGYRDVVPHAHGALCVFLDKHKSRFKLVLMPRGHFKTTVCTISRVTQKVANDPNQRILLVNETTENAENFLSAIEQHFESNRVLRTLYSSVIPKNFRSVPWNSKEMRLVRTWVGPEETVTAMGMTSAITSRHYTHITVDDPISEEAVKSPSVMEDAIVRISKFLSLMVNPDRDTFDLIGTRWALHDVYSFFQRHLKSKMARFVRAAIKDGQPIFPELISLDTLADARSMYGEYMFSCLYMNNPRDASNQDFNINDLRFWRWSLDGESVLLYSPDGEIIKEWPTSKLDITVSIDLAMSEKVSNDQNAVVTVGTTPDGEAVVLDTWVKRCTPLEVIEHLFKLKSRFHLRAVGIEAVAYQKAFKYFLKAECERRGQYMNIVELKAIPSKKGTGNNSKEMRIRGLQPVAATGRLYVLPTMHELRNQLADFPLGEHDDCIDALAHQLVMWRGVLSQERLARYKAIEDALVQRALLAGGPGTPLEEVEPVNPRDRPHPDDLGIEIPQFSEFYEVTF